MSSVIVYFSRAGSNWVEDGVKNIEVGNCELLAKFIQKQTNADIFKIEQKKQYTDEYYKATEEAKEDLKNNNFLELKNLPDVSKYDTIYLGYPIWWSTFPMAIATFLKNSNLSGKTILPFCSHEGSGIADSAKDLQKYCPNSIIKDCFEIRGYKCQNIDNDKDVQNSIIEWIKNNK